MMVAQQLPLSKIPLQRQVIVSGLTVLLACILVTSFFDRLVTVAPGMQTVLLTALWVGLFGLWLIGSILALKTWPKTTHTLTDNALQIRKKGWFGQSSEYLYRYDTILSVASTSHSHGAYGTLTLLLAQQDEIVIHGVKKPEEQAMLIKKRVVDSQSSVNLS